jgi:2-succinyl-5-enolpyruvyl-6-hydroxy-3-cyclohexene-1-carboxylate synthase
MAATALVSGRAGVIIAGSGISDPAAVTELASALGWPVLATPGSGCRGPSPAAVVVSAFDAILRTPLASSLQPDAVLRLGGSPASKVLSGWLESSDAAQVVAAPPGAWPDPERRADLVVHGDPAAVCRGILRDRPAPAPDGWAGRWRSAETAAQQRITAVLSRHDELTEPGVARSLTGALGPEATMLVASSMPIRDVEWYGDPAMHARVLANRGANGIDGLVSTALGVAAGSGGPTVALVGDLAFLHDAGGLLWAASRGVDCTFVVVDNDGGGIFGFLPPAALLEPATFERLFGTPHGLDLAALAAVHGLPVQVVDSAAAVVPAVLESVAAGGVRVVLARTDRTANVAVHDELVDGVAAALEPV